MARPPAARSAPAHVLGCVALAQALAVLAVLGLTPGARVLASDAASRGHIFQDNSGNLHVAAAGNGTAFVDGVSPAALERTLAAKDATIAALDAALRGVQKAVCPAYPNYKPQELAGHTEQIRALAMAGSTVFSGGFDDTVLMWDLEKPQPLVRAFEGQVGNVAALALSHTNDRLFCGSEDNRIRVWNLGDLPASGAPSNAFTLSGHTNNILALVTTATRLFSSSHDDTIRVWDTTSASSAPTTVAVLTDHTNSVAALALSDDHKTLFSGAWDNTIMVWNLTTPTPVREHTLTGHTSKVVSLASVGAVLFSGSEDRTIRMWSLPADGGEPVTLHTLSSEPGAGHGSGAILSLAVGSNRLFSGHSSGNVVIWDLGVLGVDRPVPTAVLPPAPSGVRALVYSPWTKHLATAGNLETIFRVWDLPCSELSYAVS